MQPNLLKPLRNLVLATLGLWAWPAHDFTSAQSLAPERTESNLLPQNEPHADEPHADTNADTNKVSFHHRIDEVLDAIHFGPEIPLASDEEFQRRIYLDLLGHGPTVAESERFFKRLGESPELRTQAREELIDDLLARDEFARYYAKVLEVMFTERREVIGVLEVRAMIYQWLKDQRPINELCMEILAADGTEASPRAAACFFLNRNADPNLVTRDVARIFLGRDIQCAQCHDHPLFSDYKQSEYYGILSLVNRTYLFKDEKRGNLLYLGEKAEGSLEFASVFEPQAGKSTAQPMLPTAMAMDSEPDFVDSSDAYIVAPEKNQRGVPRYSRRQQLAVLATHPENQAFNRNLANRLWANMMGSGLVHPVDMHHSGNPASSAQLLETLAGHLVEGQYDLREFLRQIARSKAYQRSVLAPDLNLWDGPPGGIATLCERSARFEATVRGLAPELQRQQIELQEAAKKLANSQADVQKLQLQIDQAKELYGQRIQQRDQELAKQPLETQTPEQKEILQAAQERLDDQRNRIVALVNRRLALGEFVAQARGLQRSAQRRFQAILDEQSDCKQQQVRIQALIEWLEARSRIENHESKVDPETNSQSLAQFELQSFELIESWRRAWALRTVRSLTPEQVAGATYFALEMDQPVRIKTQADWQASHREAPNGSEDPKKYDQSLSAALAGNMWETVEDLIVTKFSAPAGAPQDTFFATVDQALMIQNDPSYQSWLKANQSHLIDRLARMQQHQQIAEQLYLCVLCRMPQAQEVQRVGTLLDQFPDQRTEIVQELVWGLLASSEFRFSM